MGLKRLTPVINQRDLGYVRLWRDELGEIVRLIRQLEGAELRVEADGYIIDDVDADLPQIGSRRLKYFKVTATSTSLEGSTRYLIEVRMSAKSSQIEAADPDLSTIGVIEAICSLADRCRRLPRWLAEWYGSLRRGRWVNIITTVLGLGLVGFLIAIIVTGIITSVAMIRSQLDNRFVSYTVPYVLFDLEIGIAVLGLGLIIGFVYARTVLYTGTRADAPTWWQEHRSEIAIHVAVGVLFFGLGILVGHL